MQPVITTTTLDPGVRPLDGGCDVSIIVPVLDERDTLETLVSEIEAAFEGIADTAYEIVFVDDGSRDDTWCVVERLSVMRPTVRGIRFRRNLGKAAALSAGVARSSGRTVITMDGDLQDDPKEIPAFLAGLAGGADLVSGWKRDRKDPLSKRLPSKAYNRVTGLVTGVRLHDHNCGFKAARREVYEQVPLYGELHRYVPAMAHSLGYKVTEIPVNHRARTFGRSKYGIERYFRGFLDLLTVLLLTKYGRRPAHLFGGTGVIAGLVGFLVLAYLTGIWIFTDQPIGTRPLLLLGVLLEVLAVQLISLGILSELVLSRTENRAAPDMVIDRVGHVR